jgi:predicted HNH restriction endonuclease
MATKQAQFVTALSEIQARGLSREHRAMLQAHWAATKRTVSMAQLARAAEYPGHHVANIQYGSLAKRIAKYGHIDLRRAPMALSAIATWSADPQDPRGHFAFTMRRALADALEEVGLAEGAQPPAEGNDVIDAVEGEAWEALVRHRKREHRLRQAKIADALRESGDERLRCQVPGCEFDFEAVYGATGAGYAHVHHLKPLSSRTEPERTRLADLAVVCANCHAMIHRFGASRSLETLIPRRRARAV